MMTSSKVCPPNVLYFITNSVPARSDIEWCKQNRSRGRVRRGSKKGISPLEIVIENQKFLENLKSAA